MARWLWHRTGAGPCFSSDGDVCFSPAGERRDNSGTRQSDEHDFAVGLGVPSGGLFFCCCFFFNSSFKFFMHKVIESQRSLKKKGAEEMLMSWPHISGGGRFRR